MNERELPPEDEFDDVENTGVVPRIGKAAETDLRLLRAAIKEHGLMMGEVNEKLAKQADEMAALMAVCRRNAHNIKVLSRRVGLHIEVKDSEALPAAPLQLEAGKKDPSEAP